MTPRDEYHGVTVERASRLMDLLQAKVRTRVGQMGAVKRRRGRIGHRPKARRTRRTTPAKH